MIPVQRDLAEARQTMQRWLCAQDPAGRDVIVGELGRFDQGFSSEILTFEATYRAGGTTESMGMVVRIEPNETYQLFLDTNFDGQYRVLEALARHTPARVPPTIGFESDPAHLGARFYVTGRCAGRTGQLGLGWMSRLDGDGMERTWWNGLAAMAQIHRADPAGLGLGFLDQPRRGPDPLDQQLQYYWEYYCWVRGDETHPAVEAAYDWLRRNKPLHLPPTGVVWGDAKRGNQLFTEDLECSAVLDFEMACLGPAEMDLGWWLEGEHQTAEVLSMPPPPGIPETTARYGELIGRDIQDIEYYMIFAALRIAVLRIKLYSLRQGVRQGARYRGGPREGDIQLAAALERYAGRSVAIYA
jgi:aminoglycoside phosphotransferase (APT) family kinase protein